VAINEKDYKFLKTNSKAKHIALVPLFLTNSFFGKYEEHRESYGRSKFYFDMPFYEKKTFCYYGFIRPNKGIVELMAAWNSIRGEFPDWKLKIYAPNATLDTKVLEEMQAHFNDQIMWQSDGYTFLPFDAGEFGILPYQQCNNSSMICELIAYGSPTVTTDLEPFADYAEYRSNDITSIIRYGIANAAEMRRGIFEKRRKLFRQNHKAKKALFDLACKIYQDTLL
jgi:glycosyltransferase involved in cell wall biosynthesis